MKQLCLSGQNLFPSIVCRYLVITAAAYLHFFQHKHLNDLVQVSNYNSGSAAKTVIKLIDLEADHRGTYLDANRQHAGATSGAYSRRREIIVFNCPIKEIGNTKLSD